MTFSQQSIYPFIHQSGIFPHRLTTANTGWMRPLFSICAAGTVADHRLAVMQLLAVTQSLN